VAELLIEIGFEEMPAPWLEGLAKQLQTRFVDAAAREFLEPKEVRFAWTPRRLVLAAELDARQSDREEPVWGPALKVAKDVSGAWTAAAQGFAGGILPVFGGRGLTLGMLAHHRRLASASDARAFALDPLTPPDLAALLPPAAGR